MAKKSEIRKEVNKLTALEYIASKLSHKAGSCFNVRWRILPLKEKKRFLKEAKLKVDAFIESEYEAECGRNGIKLLPKCR